ncbi:MAG: hypothetical protein M3342_21685 [Bacteroidota bacterium]|nr:hypothetical protein [Bacteroidota bacterium]
MPADKAMRFSGDYNDYSNWNVQDNIPGTFDNGDVPGYYSWYDSTASLPNSMVFKYPNANEPNYLGKVRMGFSIELSDDYKVQQDSEVWLYVSWYKNGVLIREDLVFHKWADVGILEGRAGPTGLIVNFFETDLDAGDWIACRVRVRNKQSTFGFARQTVIIE